MKNAIEFLDKQELVEIIQDCLNTNLARVNSQFSNSGKELNSEYLTYSEAVKYLKISKPTFEKIRSELPEHRITPHRVLFKKQDLVDFLERKRRFH